MNIFKQIGSWISSGLKSLASRIRKTDSIKDAYNNYLKMKKEGLNTNATKLFESLRSTFEAKHGKSLTDRLTAEERKEAEDIARAFMEQPTATEEKAQETAKALDIDEADKVKRAKKIDAKINAIESERISKVLGSPVVNAVWMNVRNSEKSVKAMKKAIDNITDKYEDYLSAYDKIKDKLVDGYEPTDAEQTIIENYTWYNSSTKAERESDVMEEYDRIIEELGL